MGRDGANRPGVVFAIVAILLTGGVAFSRFAIAGEIAREDSTEGKWVQPIAVGPDATRYDIGGSIAIGAGECAALQKISEALAENSDRPVVVTWTETYGGRHTHKEVDYLPQRQRLQCSDNGSIGYTYQPVTRAGIQAAIANGSAAGFAGANLYSLPASVLR